jgi:glutamate 5-kinase
MSDTNNILVVKLGSSSVTKIGGPDYVFLTSALSEAIDVQQLGWNIVLVSSGAVSSGMAYLAQFGHNASRRLAAAVGKPLLMNMYSSPVTGQPHALC